MKSTILKLFTMFLGMSLPGSLGLAQQTTQPPSYTIVNLGIPFGGPFGNAVGFGRQNSIGGYVVLPTVFNSAAILWKSGSAKNLGTYGGPSAALLGGTSGYSETATTDPLGQDFCETGTFLICLAFGAPFNLSKPLPTLGGKNAVAFGNNNKGLIVGAAQTSLLDPSCLVDGQPQPPFYTVQQLLPAVWEGEKVEALAPWPGDSFGKAIWSNDNGQVVGFSGNCVTNQAAHALLWDHGKVVNLGSLGGIYGNVAGSINNKGDVVGNSDLAGDAAYHAFLWSKGVMTDLGTLPGDVSSYANSINDAGEVVGGSCDVNGNCRQVLWANGTITDINTLTPVGSALYLEGLYQIDDHGRIVGYAYNQNTGFFAAFLAIPGPPAAQVNPAQLVGPMPPMTYPDLRKRLIFGSR